jgi:UBA/TS-N domain
MGAGTGAGTSAGTGAGTGDLETSPRVTRRTRHGYDRSMRRDRTLNTVNRCYIAASLQRIAESSVHTHVTQHTTHTLSFISLSHNMITTYLYITGNNTHHMHPQIIPVSSTRDGELITHGGPDLIGEDEAGDEEEDYLSAQERAQIRVAQFNLQAEEEAELNLAILLSLREPSIQGLVPGQMIEPVPGVPLQSHSLTQQQQQQQIPILSPSHGEGRVHDRDLALNGQEEEYDGQEDGEGEGEDEGEGERDGLQPRLISEQDLSDAEIAAVEAIEAAQVSEPLEESIQSLEAMGFSRERVIQALRSSGNSIEMAADELLGSS